jgi:hypothetical protein
MKELIHALAQQHDLDVFLVCEAIHSAEKEGLKKDQVIALSRDQIIELSQRPIDWKATIKKK